MLLAALMFACTPTVATSATSLMCDSGRKVTLANIRAAASSEKMRQAQRGSLEALAAGKALQCREVGMRGEAVLAECSLGSEDLGAQQVAAGHASFMPAVIAAR